MRRLISALFDSFVTTFLDFEFQISCFLSMGRRHRHVAYGVNFFDFDRVLREPRAT